MAEYSTSSFDLNQAKMGITVGYESGKSVVLATYISFDPDRYFAGFVSFGNNTKYGFTKKGLVYTLGDNPAYFNQLVMVDSSITQTQGTAASRAHGTTTETFYINTLLPREEVAKVCLGSMISKYDSPLNFDNAKIMQLVNKSFLFAQEFINQAVEYRKNETTSSSTDTKKEVKVDSASLSTDTDKILYNIQVALTNWMTQEKTQYTEKQKNGLKLAATDINIKTVPETIKLTIPESIKVSVPDGIKVSGSVSATVSGSVNSYVSGSIDSTVSGSLDASVSGSIDSYNSGYVSTSVPSKIEVYGSVTTTPSSSTTESTTTTT